MSKLSEFFKRANEEGLHFPMAKDAVLKQPSVTLFFLYLSNLTAIVSLIYLHVKGDAFIATCMSVLYAVISTILYKMKNLEKAKFDLKEESFEVESDDKKEGPHEA